ncbi:MAG: polysaccharide biosynthesis/export family protein [Bacteroidales bacterium]
MIYLQHMEEADSLIQNTYGQNTYKVQSGDIIFVRISSLNKDINEIFNSSDFVTNSYINEMSLYYKGYLVSDEGKIEMPVIGKVEVGNKTLNEIQEIIQSKTMEYFKEVYVTVKYGGFKITVLGEVKRPGVFYFFNNKVNLLEALGQAGDLTEFGNRENILLLRTSTNGIENRRINLLEKNIIKSPYFYMHPNDVIYVEPIKTKAWKMNSANVSIILSSISTLILVISFVLKIK